MATPLTPNSRIVKAIASHIETGIPITADNYHLSPDDMLRLQFVFKLYTAWRKNPMLNKQEFLKAIGRRSQDMPNDLYCFTYIKSLTTDLMLPKEDLLILQQRAAMDAYQAAKDLGDTVMLLKAAKMLGDIVKEMPEVQEVHHNELGDFYSNDIRDIAPDFIPVDSPTRAKMLAKYGGKPDVNTQTVEDKVARIKAGLSQSIATNTSGYRQMVDDLPDVEEYEFPDME